MATSPFDFLFGRAYLLLVLAALFWGGNAVAGKIAQAHVSPAMLTFLRWAIASLIIASCAAPYVRADWATLRLQWWRITLLALLGFAGFNLALYGALRYTSAVNVSIEQAGMPMVIIIVNFLLFRQRTRAVQLIGVLLTVAGVLVTATHGDLSTLLAGDLNRGDAIMLVAVLLYSVYAVALRLRPAVHWLSFLFTMALAAMVWTAPVLAYECIAQGCSWPSPEGWWIVAFVVLFPTLGAQLFFIRAVELIGANRAGLFINLVPMFGAGLAVIVLGETLQTYHFAGLLLVLVGIVLAEKFAPSE